MVVKRIFLALLLLGFHLIIDLPSNVFAQSGVLSARVQGRIYDEDRNTVANITLSIQNPIANFSRTTISDKNGFFYIPEIPPGPYKLFVKGDTFMQPIQMDLALGVIKIIDITLKKSEKGIVPIVTPGLVNDGQSASSNYVDRQKKASLPLAIFDPRDLLYISPRVTLDRVRTSIGQSANTRLSVNGQSARFNTVLVDGVDILDRLSGFVRPNFPFGAIQEATIATDSYSAEFGGSLSGVVLNITRNGNNEFHAGLFTAISNDSISARDPFNLFLTKFDRYQIGSVLSGPIKKDKVFFFLGFSRFTGKFFNNVTISDSIIKKARELGFPANNGEQPFAIGATLPFVRIDAHISPNNTLWGYYNGAFTLNGASPGFVRNVDRSFGAIERYKTNSIVLNNTNYSPSLNLTNETRIVLNKRRQRLDPYSPDLPALVIEDRLPVGQNSNILVVPPEQTALLGGFSLFPLPGTDSFDGNYSKVSHNVSFSRGRHFIKVGAALDSYNFDTVTKLFDKGQAIFGPLDFDDSQFNLRAIDAFDGSNRTNTQKELLNTIARKLVSPFTSIPFLQLSELPIPTIFIQAFGQSDLRVNLRFVSTFFQDDFRIRPNLLLKAGFRYDYNDVAYRPGNSGNFSPRIAFAYNPNFLPKLNIRGAYGIYFASPIYGLSMPTHLFGNQLRQIAIEIFPNSSFPFNAFPNHRLEPGPIVPKEILTGSPTGEFVRQFAIEGGYHPKIRESYSHQVKFGFDYALDKSTTISIDYNYVRGLRLFNIHNTNPVIRRAQVSGIFGNILNSPESLRTGRIFQDRGDTLLVDSARDSYYNAFTVSVNRRFANRFNLNASYVFSKIIDNVGDLPLRGRNDALNFRGERALSDQDVRSRFVATSVWDLSYTKNRFLGNFQLTSVISLESGRPYNIGAFAFIADSVTLGPHPNIRPPGLGRNLGITPGYANIDVRLLKAIPINKRYRAQVNIDILNLFNRKNIRDVNDLFLPVDEAAGFPTVRPGEVKQYLLPPKRDGRFIATKDQFLTSFSPRQIQFTVGIAF